MTTKMSYLHRIGSEPLSFTTLGNVLQSTATKHPDTIAIISLEHNKYLTFSELLDEADKFAAGLRKLGMRKGDRLGLWASNSIEWFVVNMACVRIGIILVAINPGNRATEMRYCINKVGIKTIVCPLTGKYHNYYDILKEIAPELDVSEPGNLNCDKVSSLRNIILISENEKPNGVFIYKEVMELSTSQSIQQIKSDQRLIQPDDPCYVQFSSGTTGLPKAAIATHFHAVNTACVVGRNLDAHKRHNTVCLQVPFFHVFGLTCGLGMGVYHASTLVIPSEYYSPKANLKALTDKKCNVIYGTPTMYVDLINAQRQLKLDISVEFGVTGGATCTPEMFQKMKEVLGVKYPKSAYGLTENCGPIAQSLPTEESKYHVEETVGRIVDHIEVKVIDTDGNVVPMGQPGELCVRGHATLLEYWDDEEKTKEIIGPDKWLRTGDQVLLHENGYLTVIGRLKDVIIRGGENLYPKEIENYVSTHPEVLEVHVLGIPHERLGEEVCACIKLRNGSILTQEEMTKFLKEKIAHFKIPTQLKIVSEFPKTTSGKIQKFKLKELFMNGN